MAKYLAKLTFVFVIATTAIAGAMGCTGDEENGDNGGGTTGGSTTSGTTTSGTTTSGTTTGGGNDAGRDGSTGGTTGDAGDGGGPTTFPQYVIQLINTRTNDTATPDDPFAPTLVESEDPAAFNSLFP